MNFKELDRAFNIVISIAIKERDLSLKCPKVKTLKYKLVGRYIGLCIKSYHILNWKTLLLWWSSLI